MPLLEEYLVYHEITAIVSYTHLRLLDKARAVDTLPVLTEKVRQVKTGTNDLTAHLTENPVKTQQNPARPIKCEIR